MHGNMPTDSKYKAVLSRTVICNGAINQLCIVRPTTAVDGSTRFNVTPFNLETEATVMVDYPVALMRRDQFDLLAAAENMSQMIETARILTDESKDADTALLLKPGHPEILDFQSGQTLITL